MFSRATWNTNYFWSDTFSHWNSSSVNEMGFKFVGGDVNDS